MVLRGMMRSKSKHISSTINNAFLRKVLVFRKRLGHDWAARAQNGNSMQSSFGTVRWTIDALENKRIASFKHAHQCKCIIIYLSRAIRYCTLVFGKRSSSDFNRPAQIMHGFNTSPSTQTSRLLLHACTVVDYSYSKKLGPERRSCGGSTVGVNFCRLLPPYLYV